MPRPILLPSAIVLLAALPASAAERLVDRSLEELMALDIPVVNAASKFSQKATDAPASVSVITAKDIKQFGYRTLGDALNSQAGMYIQYDRLYQSIGVRGFQRAGEYNNRVAFLLNGARTNDPVYGTAPIGHDFYLDLDLIERANSGKGRRLRSNSPSTLCLKSNHHYDNRRKTIPDSTHRRQSCHP